MLPSSLLYFCDESHIRGSDFFGIGGLAITPGRANAVSAELDSIKAQFNFPREVKYGSAKPRRDDIHRAYVDLLFDLIEQEHAHLHIRITPIKGQRNNQDVISKAFYQLLLHRAGGFYGRKCAMLIRPDDGNCTEYLPRMKAGLNSEIRRKYAQECHVDPVRDISPVSSADENVLQLLDVTLGALICIRNGNHENGVVGGCKAELAKYVLERSGISNIEDSSSIDERNINIWNVKSTAPAG